MPLDPFLPWLDLAGIAVFAASGALAAARQRLDFVGLCFFALITATGGGTLCLSVAVAAWIVPLRWWPETALEWLDALGLAAYAVYGAGKALDYGIAPLVAVAAGVITAGVGGIIRDITAGVPSILLRHELYVTAAVGAATVYVGGSWLGLGGEVLALVSVATGFVLRGAAIRWGLALPAHKGH